MKTSQTLLEQLRQPGQEAAWSRFVQLYTPLLYCWLRRCGLQEADAADLLQDIFRVLMMKLPEFEYDRDRSFRNWLRTITLNVWRNHCRQSKRSIALVADLEGIAENDDLFSEVEYRKQLVNQALELLKPEFSAWTWQVFVQHGVEGRPASEVASVLNTTVGAVYAARCRVMARLRKYLEGLLQ